MASVRLGRIASFSIIVSSGTLLTALAVGTASVTSAALFYMISATLSVSALFLLVELIERIHEDGEPQFQRVSLPPDEDTNLDDEEEPLVGRSFPVSIVLLGLAFLACALLVAGLPPLSGFLAKFSLLSALAALEDGSSSAGWAVFGLLLLSGLAATISFSRAGIQHFWAPGGRLAPELKSVEAMAVLTLILSCVLLTVFAEPVLQYTQATASSLHAPASYVDTVLSTKARPRLAAEVAP
jgi:multicomponent K+:H+ antiporter subunit D